MLRNAWALFLLVLATTPVAATSIDDVPVYAARSGHFWAGLVVTGVDAPTSGIGPVNLATVPITVDQCHRNLRFDLTFEPKEFKVGEGTPSASVSFEFVVELIDENGSPVADRRIRDPGFGFFLATVPSAGNYTVELFMRVGADAHWNFTVKGQNILRFLPIQEEPACALVRINEVEANPAGIDGGNEWIELVNAEFFDVDVGGWSIHALHGVPQELTLPSNTTVPAGSFLVVNLTGGQFLDNDDEEILLVNAWGLDVDRTPSLSDHENDARTHQFAVDQSGNPAWRFEAGTPGAANP